MCPEGWPPKPLFPPFRKCREWRDGKFTSTMAEKLPLTTQQLASAMGTPVTFSKTQCGRTGVTVDREVSPVWVGGPLSSSAASSSLPQSFELTHGVSVCTLHNFALQESSKLSPPSWRLLCTPNNSSLFSGQVSSCLPDWFYMRSYITMEI